MRKIEKMQFVSHENGEEFYKHMRSAVDNFQNAGCEIELQFQTTLTQWAVLVIGYKEVK